MVDPARFYNEAKYERNACASAGHADTTSSNPSYPAGNCELGWKPDPFPPCYQLPFRIKKSCEPKFNLDRLLM